MNQPIFFAIVAAVSFGLYSTFQNLASKFINPILGSIFISTAAVVSGLSIFLMNYKNINLSANPKGFIFAILAGICAFGIDLFALKAYGSGLPVSVGGPIIIAGSIAVVSIIGFFMGESFNVYKILGLSLVIGGIYILTSITK